MKPDVIVFLKPPVPGKVKTRLAVTIGEEAACTLYRAFVCDTLETIRKSGLLFHIAVAGNPDAIPFSWRKDAAGVFPQKGADLGERMESAFQERFRKGATSLLLVGTDTPDFGCDRLLEAACALQHQDAVLAPAEDGGYGLIGFTAKGFTPEVFRHMPWSTASVWLKTTQKLHRAGCGFHTLSSIRDVDDITDLTALFNRIRHTQTAPCTRKAICKTHLPFASGSISVVIPVWREEKRIAATITHVRSRLPHAEIIIVDGHPKATTLAAMGDPAPGVKPCTSRPGRGPQMNTGAKAATGEIFLFLHADTLLPETACADIRSALFKKEPPFAFRLAICHPHLFYKGIQMAANLRSRLFHLPYGDQALVIPRRLFHKIDGYPDWPIMEDVGIADRLRQAGFPLKLLSSAVTTSPRRWEEEGRCKRSIKNLCLLFLFRMGLSPNTLARQYRKPSA